MIDYEFKDLLLNDDIDKQILIEYDTGQLTNNEIPMDELSVEESICSEESLVFGTCEASVLKFTCNNVFEELKNKWLNVTTTPKGATTTFQIGQYKVYSDIPTADRKKRNVVAYDALYDVLQADVAEWYNDVLPLETTTVTLKKFRDKFFAHFGIEQEEATLINDDMVVAKTIQPEELSGKVVLNAICEINGCFGHIGRNGKFKYVYLEPIREGLYPSETLYPSENLYPAEPNTARLSTGTYISASYEDYLVEKITKFHIRKEEDDIGAIIGSGDNAYVIQDNFLVHGKTSEDLQTIGQNILSKIGGIYYRPFNAKAKGNPCLEVGDAISLSTKYMAVHSYILQRTLSGVQSLRDEYAAEGAQYQPAEVNSTARSIQQLKGKTNKLTRNIEETRLEMEDIEKGLNSTISITAAQIRSEVSDSDKNLQSQIAQNAGSISSEITRATNAENALSTKITQTDEKIRTDVAATYETIAVVEEKVNKAEETASSYTDTRLALYSNTNEMNSAIEQKANSITASVDLKITETKTYADTVASVAETNAMNDTANKLKSYSTTTEVKSLISTSESGITLSFNEKISETKIYADSAASSAESNAKEDTAEKLKSYSTTTEIESKILASKDGILLSVSETYEKITDAEKEYEKLRASIEVNADNIALKVSAEEVVNAINVSSESIELSGNRLVVNSTNFKLDANGNAEFSGIISGNGISLQAENYEIKTVMKTSEFSSGNVALTLNEADDFEYVDIYGPVYVLGGDTSESFLGANTLDCSDLNAYTITVGTYGETDGDIICYGNVKCTTLNGYKAITSGNIENYWTGIFAAADTSYLTADETSSGNIQFNGKTAVSTTYLATTLYDYAEKSDLPDIVFTAHNEGGYGSYYYSTNSDYASGDNKSIPSIQWVKDYVNSKVS